jgi:hypothetical protein
MIVVRDRDGERQGTRAMATRFASPGDECGEVERRDSRRPTTRIDGCVADPREGTRQRSLGRTAGNAKPSAWDADPNAIDLEADADSVLARVLESGRLSDVRRVIEMYGLDRIHCVFRTVGHSGLSRRRSTFGAHSFTLRRSYGRAHRPGGRASPRPGSIESLPARGQILSRTSPTPKRTRYYRVE